MKINNEMYEAQGGNWWADDAGFELSSLRYCVNPVRYGYFRRKLLERNFSGKRVLDVGCGGGFLSEEFARDGFMVTGIDPSPTSVDTARRHAAEGNLTIDYRVGRGEALPFPDGSFDVVACCDVLEHVDDPGRVIVEISRVLKPGGLFFFDTVNRTWFSKFVLIKIAQDWRLTRVFSPNSHLWEKFIRPDELVAAMNDCGLAFREMRGIAAAGNPLLLLRKLRAVRSGRIRNEEITDVLRLRESDGMKMSYMGFAVKQPAE